MNNLLVIILQDQVIKFRKLYQTASEEARPLIKDVGEKINALLKSLETYNKATKTWDDKLKEVFDEKK